MSTLLVDADRIFKRYVMKQKTIDVLCGASLAVSAGESVAVVGRSGAGKSTLLHILGGLDRPDPQSGRIAVAGYPLFEMRGARRTRARAQSIGFIFQSYHLIHEMDVLDNMMLPARAMGGNLKGKRERALALLASVGMGARATHTPVELSGGEQQRVAIARALMNEPRVILADEPTGNLDDDTGRDVLAILFALCRDQGHALVMVTHNEHVAATCDRTLHLSDGLLAE